MFFGPGGFGAGFSSGATGIRTISGLQLWYESDYGGNILDGSSISQWTDRSGSGFNAYQPTSGAQASIASGVLNGYDVASFDGATDFYPLSGLSLNMLKGVGGATISVVIKSSVATAGSINVFTITNNTTGTRFTLMRNGAKWQVAARQDDAGSATVLAATNSLSTSTWYSLIMSADFATDTLTLVQNNDTVQQSAGGWTGANICSNTTSGFITFGAANQTPQLLFSGQIAFVGIWNKALTSNERAIVRARHNRYGLGLT